ncbi:polysaccharide deacetylase family protein [Bacillus sp. Marseille-P3661]|uniref:polysaccharide deacetylase family protein n=1 Tax=Bacillus sp. Marseille-P3661 TaxID=1936234 RepID=UPI000C8378FD|nr:polysaccharide deacetylase family protein [Bacillus sp. Marseille-P3661]
MRKVDFKKIITLNLIVSIIFCCLIPISSFAQESQLAEAPIFIDGEPFDTKFIMREGHLLVPALFLKHTGTFVDWNNEYQSVVFNAKDKMFAVPIGKKFTDDFNPRTGTWERGVLTTKAIKFQNEVFVPLIDVVKKLNMDVKYDTTSDRTYITTHLDVKFNSIRNINTNKKLVALTFDDGPENHYTPQILDILKEKGVPATFFVMGQQVKAYPKIMQRIVNEGHAIGNHSYTHPNLSNEWSATVRKELESTLAEIQYNLGIKPDLLRPPYGSVTKADVAMINRLGLRNIMWSVDTMDWSGLSSEQILQIVERQLTPGGIILQHNFQEGLLLDGSVEALPQIIDNLHAKGYKFVTIQTLLANNQ